MFDHILHAAMEALGVDRNYIGNFSIWGITSNQGWNLILTEALSNGISFGISAAAKGICRFARWAGSYLTGKFAGLMNVGKDIQNSVNRVLRTFGTTIDDVLSLGISKSLKQLSEMTTTRDLARVLFRGVREYFGLVGEVIFEMAFDNILRYDKSARPWGGGEAFLTAMSLSILTSAAMRAVGRRGITTFGTDDGTVVMKASRARLILPTLALSLQMSMLVMRIPVMLGNMR
jgi:hypothetical protein